MSMCECACVLERTTNSLGCKVGTCCPNLSSLSMCSSVVLPALSRPRNTNLPDFLYSPETKPEVFQTTSLDITIAFFFFFLNSDHLMRHIIQCFILENFTHVKTSPRVNSGEVCYISDGSVTLNLPPTPKSQSSAS